MVANVKGEVFGHRSFAIRVGVAFVEGHAVALQPSVPVLSAREGAAAVFVRHVEDVLDHREGVLAASCRGNTGNEGGRDSGKGEGNGKGKGEGGETHLCFLLEWLFSV
jgi:hypothetical protein